ncbi:hypothetical protein APHAL10511_001214 [Amanita phalloides]|nr:hypothetical protein APHAL10511_001214 [Amanita phalloides]
MAKKKSRPQRPSTPPPAPIQDDDSTLVDDLLAQLDSNTQSSPWPQPPPSHPAAPKQNPKSRFLARQARRAATIASASPQIDPASQERLQREIDEEEKAIRRTCDQLGLDIFHINPDGHCLFSSVADQLSSMAIIPKSQLAYLSVRRAAADYIQSHPDDFIPFLPSLSGEDTAGIMSRTEFERYCALIRDTAEWGGEPEILALSRAYDIPIYVVQGGIPSLVKHESDGADTGTSDRNIIFISYHRRMYGLGEHYNSLHRKSAA